MNRTVLPPLTGVRGLAALWVFCHHFAGFASGPLNLTVFAQSRFVAEGFRGVDLFFILSGFILMHVHNHDFVQITRSKIMEFYTTRFFRVFPLNAAILLFIVPFVINFPDFVADSRNYADAHYSYKAQSYSMLGFFQSLLLAQTWTYFKLGEWNGPAWTLSAEVLGYFIFPFIATRIVRIMSAAVCILCAFMCLVILSLVLLATHHAFEYQNPSGTIGAARMIFEFICGMFMQRYFILQIEPRMAPDSIICGALGFIILTLFIPALAMLCAFAFAVLIVGLAYNRGTVRYIFENKFSLFMGKISFSFYLIHGFVISFASWLCRARAPFVSLYDNPMSVVIVLLLCLSLSLLTYWLIERPFQKLGRSIANNQPA